MLRSSGSRSPGRSNAPGSQFVSSIQFVAGSSPRWTWSRWGDYTRAKEEMFAATDTDAAPWICIKSNDKKRARLNAMRYFLSQYDYEGKDVDVVGQPDPRLVRRARDMVGD